MTGGCRVGGSWPSASAGHSLASAAGPTSSPKIKAAADAARRAHPGVELIDMGVGEPDQMADPAVVAELAARRARPENRFYADNGIVPSGRRPPVHGPHVRRGVARS